MTKMNPISFLKQTAREKKLLELAIEGSKVKDENTGKALKIWTGTQEQYDLIETPDESTIYIITEDEV